MNEKASLTRPLRAAIVGGGIGGLAAACSLMRRGIDVTVFEQAAATRRGRRRRLHLSEQPSATRANGLR